MANNGKQSPSNNIQFERTPVKCPRCKRPFGDFVFEVMEGLVQLRCGNALLLRAEITCIHCGALFHWTIQERNIETMVAHYEKLLKENGGTYAPE